MFQPSRLQAVYPDLAKRVDLRGWIYSLKPSLVNPDFRLLLSLSTELSLEGLERTNPVANLCYFDLQSLDNLELSGLESEYRDLDGLRVFRPALPHLESFHRYNTLHCAVTPKGAKLYLASSCFY